MTPLYSSLQKCICVIVFLFIASCSDKLVTHNNPSKKIKALHFTISTDTDLHFLYSDTTGNAFLRQLRMENALLDLIADCDSDLEKTKAIMNWTHQQWKHNGSNVPSKNDALTILNEARAGKQFRCVEYGIVLATSLSAIGIPARVLALKTKDVEIVKSGAGHVLAEVYLRDLRKWVMADAQFNVILMLDNVPLNAVEFQQAIIRGRYLEFYDSAGAVDKVRKARYLNFIPNYLYFFDVNIDNRFGIGGARISYQNKSKLMLVPVGASNPTVFQITGKIDYCSYTTSVTDFYQKPQ